MEAEVHTAGGLSVLYGTEEVPLGSLTFEAERVMRWAIPALCPRCSPGWNKALIIDHCTFLAQVFILRKAVVGVGTHVRAFPEWKEEHVKHYSEPPKDHMVAWRQRMADCFGFGFTQVGLG